MKLFIGIPTAEYGRSAVFADYVQNLHKPPRTIGASFHTNSAAWNRNLIIDEALYSECSHILFIDDDMAFAPNSLLRLMKHDKSIVSGLYFNRGYPHTPILFDSHPVTKYQTHYLVDGEHGLIECEAVGFGFLLVNTEVFSKLDKPYVRMGQLLPDQRSEDIDFCLRARAVGYSIHCDLDTVIGHIGQATFWPSCIGGKWHTAIDTCGNELINIPQVSVNNEYRTRSQNLVMK